MRRIVFMMGVLASFCAAQTMSEVGAATAGSVIGSAAGKKVSDSVNTIFGKLDATTKKAARADESTSAPLLDVGPGTPKKAESVPPPPAPKGMHRAAKPVEPEAMPEIVPPPPPPPPPPPQATADDLRKVTNGTSRADLLKLGDPASRIMMSDDGHVLETYSYASKDAAIGRVKLQDGVVASVEVWQQ